MSIAQVLVGPSKQLEQIIQTEHNIVKNPNWPEANQLAIYKRGGGYELGATKKQIQEVVRAGLEPGTAGLHARHWPLGHAASKLVQPIAMGIFSPVNQYKLQVNIHTADTKGGKKTCASRSFILTPDCLNKWASTVSQPVSLVIRVYYFRHSTESYSKQLSYHITITF